MIRATKETEAGRRYLDLQRKAKHTGRPTDELIQLYALECFLDRLARSVHVDRFVLKGGVLLAALDARRPTRDIDLAAHGLENSAEHVLLLIREIAVIAIADGLIFDAEHATAETIRDDDHYSGVRVTLGGELSRATIRLHVDINVGDPIWPEPQQVRLPRLLDGTLLVRGYPLEMVFAEKIVTALTRGTANTRWRDFLDLYVLIRRHAVDAETLRTSIQHVAQYRGVPLSPLKPALAGFPDIAQSRWLAWLRKQRLETAAPAEFATVLELVISFADPLISNDPSTTTWNPFAEAWGGTG
ncbi:MAG: nucleotidyl transferase AbiEii/AbiGii toxin family protein [Steroidobacteraceae bacterium]